MVMKSPVYVFKFQSSCFRALFKALLAALFELPPFRRDIATSMGSGVEFALTPLPLTFGLEIDRLHQSAGLGQSRTVTRTPPRRASLGRDERCQRLQLTDLTGEVTSDRSGLRVAHQPALSPA